MSNKFKEFKSMDSVLIIYINMLRVQSLPFSQAVASMYTSPQVISTSPKTIFD